MFVNFVVNPRIAKLCAHILSYFSTQSILTLVIDESYHELFSSAEAYIGANSTPSILGINQDFVNDTFDNIQVEWRSNFKDKTLVSGLLKSYELSFEKKNKDKVMNSYLPHILQQGKAVQEQTKKRKINLLRNMTWISSSELDKSITFSTVSMSSKLKQQMIRDLDAFINSGEYYRSIGKARKRTYLISGTVDQDKSRLMISAMANHLNYNIYEADLSEYVEGDDIRELLLHHITRCILVVKDIESPIEVEPAYKKRKGEASARINEVQKQKLVLKLLRSINGLWLPRGNEVIVVFTMNREKIQPNLFEPGWIDMQMDFSCLTDTIKD